MRAVSECTLEEQARLAAGLPITEQMAILCDDREFYLYCRAAWPQSPSLWVDLDGCPDAVKKQYAKHSTKQYVEARADFFGTIPVDKTNRFFERYFSAPDFEPKKSTARAARFADAAEGWDIP